MAINVPKVITGGLVAGVVLNVVDFLVYNYLLGDRMAAEMNAVVPGMSEKMMTTNAIVSNVVCDFVLGILVVWIYAAMRPRFGPGVRTAVFATIPIWISMAVAYWGYVMGGMMSTGLYATASAFALVNILIASWVGGRLYSE